jgi:hypothetical protein
MMAICSDLDETPDRRVYWEIARFLNTTEQTWMGPGVGLEVGNSVFFWMPSNQFSYWGTDDAGREMVRSLISSRHIDCLHSYGDNACRREHAERVIAELERYGCKLKVWVDHSISPSNFGPDIMCGQGDVPTSTAYHADITTAYGIRYVWRGRTTGILGQNAPVNASVLAAMFEPRHPYASTRTLCKETAKVVLGHFSRPRWQMHAANDVCRPSRLRDGRPIWEFMRADPFWGGQSHADNADGISHVLTRKMLDLLVRRRAVWVLYTHLGKVTDPQEPFGQAARDGLRLLKAYHDSGAVLVTTTHRLLRYLTVRDCLRYRVERTGARWVVTFETIDDPVEGPRPPMLDELQGLTLETPRSDVLEVRLGTGESVRCTSATLGDTTCWTVPWKPLVFPDLHLSR